MKKRVTVKTSRLILILVALLLCFAIVRLSFIALKGNIDGVDLETFANNRNTVTKKLYASRGTIYDSSGEALAQNVNEYTLIAYLSPTRTQDESKPYHVVDKEGTAEALAGVINLSKEKILSYLNKDVYQVEFGTAGKLNEIQKEKIDALDLPGIDFIVSQTRYYKMSTFASYIIGYAKKNDDGEINGELGIESYYNNTLKGVDGKTEYQQDAYGYKMANVPEYTTEAENGSDIYLTIDSNIQLICENSIKNLTDNYKMDWGLIAVMDAKTGALVASATYPSFNPNNLSTLESYLNPLVSYAYEPGSTMKTFSFATSIDIGKYDGKKTYKSGSIDVADVTIRDANRDGWGTISYDTGFAYSSNVAATKLALDVGKNTLYQYYSDLGFGKETGIELSGEVKGDIDFKYQSELATASFGQGITITPIQMLQALTSITNDGVVLKPYIISKIVDKNGKVVYEGKRQEVKTVFKKETTDYVKQLMYNVVYNGLTKMWRPENVTLIAKTGTAQIASSKGGYQSGEYNHITSLAGAFPSEDPKYIIYIVNKRMQGPRAEQAKALTKTVDEIASYAKLTEKNTSNEKVAKTIKLKNYVSAKVDTAKKELEDLKLKVHVIGDGEYVTEQYPSAKSITYPNSNVFLKTNYNEIKMIDLKGFSMSEVKTYAKLINKNIKINGYGYVKSQSIKKDEVIKDDTEIEVTLE